MGKKTRKSSRNSRGSKNRKAYEPPHSDNVTTTTTAITTNNPAILQRLRHADSKTRHAALAALLHTRFHPDTLQKTSNPTPKSSSSLSKELLQAVRDQVCNGADLPCSIAAASCLGHYLAFCDIGEDAVSAGWLVIFLQRLNEFLKQPVLLDKLSSSSSPLLLLLWLELAEKCVYCTVHLLENNPAAVDRLLAPQQTQNGTACIMPVLTQLLQRSHQALQSAAAAAAAAAHNDNTADAAASNEPTITPSTSYYWLSIQTLAARCLHSVWDDNVELVVPYMMSEGNAAACMETLAILRTIMTTTTNASSTVASLHCAGAWMAAWLIILTNNNGDGEHKIKAVLDAQVSQCLLLLHRAVSSSSCNNSVTDLQLLVDKLRTAETEYKAEQADQEMERDVLRKQSLKKEPARLIARRHKQQKGDDDNNNNSAASAMEDDDDDDKVGPKNKGGKLLPRDGRDKAAVWQEVQAEWQDAIRPAQLALELFVNVTSAQPAMALDDDDDDEDVIMQEPSPPMLPEELAAKLVESQLPAAVYQLFLSLSEWYRGAVAPDELPITVCDSVSDLLCKAAVSLRHCLANVSAECLQAAAPGAVIVTVQWSALKAAAAIEDDSVQEAVTSTMVVALRSRSAVRTQIGQADLNDLLALLASSSTSNRPVVARDAVCMLGILCSEEAHPVEVNEKVCAALLQASTAPPPTSSSNNDQLHPSAMVLAEVLSVLMDIYGDDDCHPAVFDARGVLGHFQRSLPLLKQKIAVEQLTKNRSPEEIAQWKETAVNAARFIQYKKGNSS